MIDQQGKSYSRKKFGHVVGIFNTAILTSIFPTYLGIQINGWSIIALLGLLFFALVFTVPLTLVVVVTRLMGGSSISVSKEVVSAKISFTKRNAPLSECGWFFGTTRDGAGGCLERKQKAIIVCVGAHSFWSSAFRIAICGNQSFLMEWESYLMQIGIPERKHWKYPWLREAHKDQETKHP